MEKRNEKGGIAYCIPTYNHPEVMQDVLSRCAWLYQEYQIDIYIYDSSTDDKTYQIVDSLTAQGCSNLYYVGFDPSIRVGDKILMLLSGYGLQKEYRYIWPVKDRVVIERHTLEVIAEASDKDYDAVFLTMRLHPFEEKDVLFIPEVYDDPVEFYGEWGWLATSLETTIFRAETMLKDIDWDDFRGRYFFNEENRFEHFTALFHSLAQKEKCAVRVILPEDVKFYSSPLSFPSWIAQTFHIWASIWPKLNRALPLEYDKYKSKVIKKATTLPGIFGTYNKLVKLRMDGILTPDVYAQVCGEWEMLSDIPREDLKLIAYEQYSQVHHVVMDRLKRLLASGRYTEADLLYRSNGLMVRAFGGAREYALIGDFLEIYEEEKRCGVKRGIFDGASDYDHLEQKYMALKYLLRRIEYDIAKDSWKEASEFIRDNHISSTFIAYMADKSCIEKEQTVDKLVGILNMEE